MFGEDEEEENVVGRGPCRGENFLRLNENLTWTRRTWGGYSNKQEETWGRRREGDRLTFRRKQLSQAGAEVGRTKKSGTPGGRGLLNLTLARREGANVHSGPPKERGRSTVRG